MSNENNSIKFIDGKVLFSKEIIEYFENLRTERNSEWIDKYFEVLNDESNLNAVKYRNHHVIPCFGFKDENHKTRKETLSLANKIEYNIIKLSVYNHIIAHYYLWKIFNNEDSRRAVYLMYEKRNLDYLSENEIKEFAKIQEECAKENMTEEEKREWVKKWNEKHKDELRERSKKRYEEHKEEKAKKRAERKKERSEYDRIYYLNNKEKKLKYNAKYRETHKEERRKNLKKDMNLKKMN